MLFSVFYTKNHVHESDVFKSVLMKEDLWFIFLIETFMVLIFY